MPKREAALVEVLFEHEPIDARLARAGEVCLVDLEDAIERGHVEHELARLRRQRPADAGGAAHRRDDHMVRGRPAQDGGDMLAGRRPSDQYTWRRIARPLVHQTKRPEIPDRALFESAGPDELLEINSHPFGLAAKRPASQPVRMGTPNPHGPL